MEYSWRLESRVVTLCESSGVVGRCQFSCCKASGPDCELLSASLTFLYLTTQLHRILKCLHRYNEICPWIKHRSAGTVSWRLQILRQHLMWQARRFVRRLTPPHDRYRLFVLILGRDLDRVLRCQLRDVAIWRCQKTFKTGGNPAK
jgi:hypothetical protein